MSEIEKVYHDQRYRNNKRVMDLCVRRDCRSPILWAVEKGIHLKTLYYRMTRPMSAEEMLEPPPNREFRSTAETEALIRCVCAQVGASLDPRVFSYRWTVAKGARAVHRHHSSLSKRMAKFQVDDQAVSFWLTMAFFIARRRGLTARRAEEIVRGCDRGESVPCYPGNRGKL